MNLVTEIAIAGLLHDVGKVLQRAGTPLTDQARRMSEMLCPQTPDGRPTHQHVLWTNDFLETMRGRLPEGLDAARLMRLASQHHRPGAAEDWLIAEADRLASGHDRRPDDAGEERTGYRQVALKSVLATAALGEGQDRTTPLVWLPAPVAVDDSLLPHERRPDEVENAWAGLAKALLDCAAQMDLSGLSPNRAIQSLIGFSERYQSLVPASAMDRPDVSLHDHAVLTAALACVLCRFHERQGDLTESAIRSRREPKFRFVVGSLSGIQEFIFASPARPTGGVARTYRAKSFYLSVLTEAVVARILEATDLPPVCAVLNAGGRFVVLADASDRTLEQLREAEQEIVRWLADRHVAAIGLNLGCDVVASGKDLLDGGFAEVYRRLELSADAAKRQPMAGILRPEGRWVPDLFRRQSNAQQAAEEFQETAKRLGAVLPRAGSLGLFPAGQCPPGLLDAPLDCLGYCLQLGDTRTLADAECALWAVSLRPDAPPDAGLPFQPMANYVPLLTPPDIEHLQRVGPSVAGIEEDEPLDVGGPATFGHLATLACTATEDGLVGRPMLACLKADVDRLGLLFSRGLGEGDVSFGRVATMSRLLDLFFKSHLVDRFSRADSPYRLVYTVFSGGDDLMLIGPWPVMLRLARDLRRWLDDFTGRNRDVTLTAALVLAHPKTPPSDMARAAEEQMEEAKQKRNCVAVLGRVLTWEDYGRGLECGERLRAMLRSDSNGQHDTAEARLRVPSAFVYRLLMHARSAERVRVRVETRQDIPLADLTWRSHYLYDLNRNVARRLDANATPAQRNDIEWLKTLLPVAATEYPVTHVILGATYALYMTRGGKHE